MDDIPRVRGLSEAEFVERFLIPNRPCILTDVVPRWRIYREWRTFDRFVELFGDVEVPACVCTGDVECGADSFEGDVGHGSRPGSLDEFSDERAVGRVGLLKYVVVRWAVKSVRFGRYPTQRG